MDNKIFNKMIYYLNDNIEIDINSNHSLFLTFYKHFNEINYSIYIIDTITKNPIYSNRYYHEDFESLFSIFKKETHKIPSMTITLKYNSEYQTFDLN
jgi:hypothetical protein